MTPSEALRIDPTRWRARRVPLVTRREAGGTYVDGVDLDERCCLPLLEPGDYCGPTTEYTGVPAVFFLLPVSRDPDCLPENRAYHHVCAPPHTFRECPDGSLEVR